MEDVHEAGDLRRILCTVNTMSLLTQSYTFSITFYFSFKWRTFLILYAEGFVKQGHVNLSLFKVLFWLLWGSILTILLGTVPFPVYLRGNFPEGLPVGKVCLQKNLGELDKKDKEANTKTTIMGFVGCTVVVLYTYFFFQQGTRFLSKLCPNNKM